MKRRALLALLIVAFAAGRVRAVMAQADKPKFSKEELDQVLAPIALYPDALLSQILMAASYPLEVVEAARWSKANPTLKGDAAVSAVNDKTWDASVKSLVAFPDVLAQMNEHLDWTQKMGDAMISQQADVADSIQRLRGRANAAGNLKSTPQQTVTTEGSGDNIQYVIEPANPEVVYAPSYNPSWAYGSWPYPSYPPVWYPFGGALMSGIFWGAGIAAAGAMFGGWNWGGYGNSYANINVNKATNIDRSFNRNNIGDGGRWQHRVDHRKGVAYRDQATRDRFGQQRPGVAQRDQFRGRLEAGGPGAGPGGGIQRPGGGAVQRPGGGLGQGGGGIQRPGGGAVQRPGGGLAGGGGRPGGGLGGGVAQRPGGGVGGGQIGAGNRRPGGMNGVNRGQQVNRNSQRGHQQMNRSGGGGGGRPAGGGGGGRPGGGGGGRPGGGRR